jgi:polyhydroxybutyrate depolymerase
MNRLIAIGILIPGLGLIGVNPAVPSAAERGGPSANACSSRLAPGDYEREVPGWPNRNYLLHVPSTYDCSRPTPVVIALHGGGSRKEQMRIITCPSGRTDDPGCLDSLADREGFIVVYPDGTENLLWRTFNATSGATDAGRWSPSTGYACVSGFACANNVDELAYFNALLDAVESVVSVDEARVYATGISNGAAMAHRLACELSDRIAAIAPVAGGNQYALFNSCVTRRAVPIIEFHGTADPAWGYGTLHDDQDLNGQGVVISVPRTILAWRLRDGCLTGGTIEDLPDLDPDDGSTVTRVRYEGCRDGAEIVLYQINGGGHMWPDGYQWDALFARDYGPTNRDINGNEVMWEFFKAHPLR